MTNALFNFHLCWENSNLEFVTKIYFNNFMFTLIHFFNGLYTYMIIIKYNFNWITLTFSNN